MSESRETATEVPKEATEEADLKSGSVLTSLQHPLLLDSHNGVCHQIASSAESIYRDLSRGLEKIPPVVLTAHD